MTDQLKPLSKEERKRFFKDFDEYDTCSADKLLRALRTIDDLERELDAVLVAPDVDSWKELVKLAYESSDGPLLINRITADYNQMKFRQKKLVEALKILRCTWCGGLGYQQFSENSEKVPCTDRRCEVQRASPPRDRGRRFGVRIKQLMIDGNCECGMPLIWFMRDDGNWKWLQLHHSCIAYLRWKIHALGVQP